MEFGALQCTPKNPDCGNCIFKDSCAALQKKKVALLPVKSKKVKVRTRHFNYLIFLDENENTLLQKRTEKGIWQNLYEFPLLETENELTEEELLTLMQNQQFVPNEVLNIHWYNSETTAHKLSHQHLNINFWKIGVKGKLANGINWESAKKMPFPIVIFNFIEKERF